MSLDTTIRYSQANIFVSGGICGTISRSLTAPADRLKILFQSGVLHKNATILHTITSIFNEGGLISFWRGNLTNCIKIGPESAMKFLVFDLLNHNHYLHRHCPDSYHKFLCGGIAGIIAQTVVYPLEIMKTRLALSPHGQYSGILDCFQSTIHANGFKSLYKGMGISVIGIIPYCSVDLGLYHTIRDYRKKMVGTAPSALEILCIGSISSITGQIVAYPAQCMRTKMQSQGQVIRLASEIMVCPSYNGIMDCFMKTLHYDGAIGFYRGILPNFCKSVPAISVSYLVFEKTKPVVSRFI
eukprot:614437_1